MMPNAIADHVSLQLDEKLTHQSRTHFECYIRRVYDRLRRQNENAYEPEILAIGPYHRGKGKLREMEEHKLWYLQLLLERRNETSVERYIVAMRDLQERAQRCYNAESLSLNKDEFVEMMLLDGCFIIELFRKFTMTGTRDTRDPLFKMDWIHLSIWRDLMLFENQIPFFVLVQFFNMTRVPDPRDNIIDLALRYFFFIRQHYFHSIPPNLEMFLIATHDVKHLLGLVHHIVSSSLPKLVDQRNVGNKEKRWEFIHCATELEEAGIRLKKARNDTHLLDIKFISGTLEIPQFTIDEKSECFMRNLIAYEEHLQDSSSKYYTDYLTFMFCLINSAKDVSLLRRYGILNNMLGDDEAASTVFSKASACLFVSGGDFWYSKVFNNINAHCRRRRNIWTAKLRRNYFNSPWKFISFLGVVVLLLLTLTQTVSSIFPYFSR